MILLFGCLADRALQRVAAELLAKSAELLVIEERHYDVIEVSLLLDGVSPRGLIRYGGRVIDLEQISSAYVRWAGLGNSSGMSVFSTMFSLLPGLVVNRPYSNNSNRSKPYQLQLIERHGLHVPKTVVTTDPNVARAFWEQCNGNVVYKSTSNVRSIVQRMSKEDLDRLHLVARCPVQFQEYIRGNNVRVHVVGSRVFSVAIDADATDYRYANSVAMRPIRLPSEKVLTN